MINRRLLDGKKELALNGRALIMGILNVTPDSFSDGGSCVTPEAALAKAKALVENGADIIDIGAESTRPGAIPLTAEEEQERLLPVLDLLYRELTVPISVDTYHAATAETAVECGADIINDVKGLQNPDEYGEMAKVAARTKAPVIIMHNADLTEFEGELTEKIKEFFRRSLSIAKAAGVEQKRIILDPGIGFGKNTAQNLDIIKNLSELILIDNYAYPILLGASRKRFIGDTLNADVKDRLEGTIAAHLYGLSQGADILRVHDVKEVSRAVKMWEAIGKR